MLYFTYAAIIAAGTLVLVSEGAHAVATALQGFGF